MRLWHLGAVMAVAAALGVAPAAGADTTIYYHAGSWDAFEATGAGNQPVCGVGSHNLADGSSLSLRFQLGGNHVTFTASKPGWQIPDGTEIPVVMQVGLSQPWTLQAAGTGDRVEWPLDTNAMQTFDAQFRGASSMTITFPAGTEPPWVIGLRGSRAISDAMNRCVTDLRRRPSAAAQPQSTTQPYEAMPAAPPPGVPDVPQGMPGVPSGTPGTSPPGTPVPAPGTPAPGTPGTSPPGPPGPPPGTPSTPPPGTPGPAPGSPGGGPRPGG